MAGTTVSKAIAKWFKGKEMAMAMGLEMSIARLGVFAAMWLAPMVSAKFGGSVSAPVLFGATLLAIGFIFYFVFVVLDRKLDKQLEAAGELTNEASEEEFKFSDLGKIFTSKMFWLVALLCVLYYSAIFPFQRYAPDFLNKTLDIDNGSQLFSCFPILAMVLTPFLGGFIDRKGKAASMLMVGSLIMIACHLCFAFVLPAVPSKAFAIAIIAILGVSFSLVPAALWPSVPKIIDERILGSAYCVIFWIQNWGLLLVPVVIGKALDATGGYTVPMIIFSSFGVFALLIGFMLKHEDKKKGYGLELPNIKE
jgi:nitrate/nitrite transporter NarK